MTSRRLPRPLLGLLAAAVIVTATGCVRVETPPPPSRTASAATLERDALAASLDDLAESVAQQAEPTVASAVESHSLDALIAGIGPRYVAYPDASPSVSASPVSTDVAALASDALSTSLSVATTTADTELRAWSASATLVHGLAVWLDAADSGAASTSALARGLPVDGLDSELTLPATSSVGGPVLADLALRHDQARYLYQLVASRLTGSSQEDALERAAIHASRSETLQALSGEPDERTEVYSTPAGAVADAAAQAETLREAESSLGSAYAASATSSDPEDLRWLLDGAFDAYAAESLLDGWTVWDVPVLPGLEAPAPTTDAE